MICYKCDMCGDLHYDIGEMNNVKISYAGKASVTYINNGEYLVCHKCENDLTELLNTARRKIKEKDEEPEKEVAPVQLEKKETPKPKADKPAKAKRKVVVDIGKAKALRTAGWSYEKIANEFGCCTQTVINCLTRAEKKNE